MDSHVQQFNWWFDVRPGTLVLWPPALDTREQQQRGEYRCRLEGWTAVVRGTVRMFRAEDSFHASCDSSFNPSFDSSLCVPILGNQAPFVDGGDLRPRLPVVRGLGKALARPRGALVHGRVI